MNTPIDRKSTVTEIREDSPRPVTYQLDLLRSVGFKTVELLHKNSCFAAFGGIKSDS
jgi:tRNA (cmo5U34)-methyltransferase